MSNKRVKSLAYDDDLDDSYDDDDHDEYDYANQPEGDGTVSADSTAAGLEALSEEDEIKLKEGVVKVRQALGSGYVGVKEGVVREGLWFYYWDVGKTVGWIKEQHQPKLASGTATPHKQGQPGLKSYSPRPVPTDIHYYHPEISTSMEMKEFWHDTPWLAVPAHRAALMIEIPLYSRSRLLGGAPKPKEGKVSKIAALAAKRRQAEAAKSGRGDESTTGSGSGASDDYTETLNQLRISQSQSRRASVGPAPQDTEDDQTANDVEVEGDHKDEAQIDEQEKGFAQDLRGNPSAFARTLASLDSTPGFQGLNIEQLGLSGATFKFNEPSPDDVISKAQNKTTNTNTSKSKTKDSAKKADISSGVANVSIQDKEKDARVKSKNINVLAEYAKMNRKNAANFVVVGHVDAGKSTLMGRLLVDLKSIDARTMSRYKSESEAIGKGSFAFAWVMDQGTDERERGVTIDIAQHTFETKKMSFTILDAPGHRDFVPNMIAGASEADFALLVVDASAGEFESGMRGQTREHALLVRAIGAQRVVVAVNKMDAAGWEKERFEEIQKQLEGFLVSAGFQKGNLAFIPCSGLEGENILKRSADQRAKWWDGPTLVEELDKIQPMTHAVDKPLRMTINDVFRGSVQNPLSISGRIEAGNLQIGDAVLITPANETAHIKAIDVDDESADWAVAGMNVVLHLSGIEEEHLKSGDVLCNPTSPIKNVREFTAKVLAFKHLLPMLVDVHRGRMHAPGRIGTMIATLDKASAEVVKKRPKVVQPGGLVRVRVVLERDVPVEERTRVILRAGGETVAAGVVE